MNGVDEVVNLGPKTFVSELLDVVAPTGLNHRFADRCGRRVDVGAGRRKAKTGPLAKRPLD